MKGFHALFAYADIAKYGRTLNMRNRQLMANMFDTGTSNLYMRTFIVHFRGHSKLEERTLKFRRPGSSWGWWSPIDGSNILTSISIPRWKWNFPAFLWQTDQPTIRTRGFIGGSYTSNNPYTRVNYSLGDYVDEEKETKIHMHSNGIHFSLSSVSFRHLPKASFTPLPRHKPLPH